MFFFITELEDKNNKMGIKLQSGRATKKKNRILHSLSSGRTRQPKHDCNSILNFIVTCFLCYLVSGTLSVSPTLKCCSISELLFVKSSGKWEVLHIGSQGYRVIISEIFLKVTLI